MINFSKKLLGKSSLAFYSIMLLGCALFAIILGNAYLIIDRQIISYNNEYFPTIIIDAGHGGEDGGAKGISGSLEKDINLSIAKILRDMFMLSGFKVEMTRDEDISIYDDSAKTVRQKKISDLRNRLKIINSNKNAVLVSVHQNKFTDSKYSGTQVFYSQKNELSRDLAEQIKKAVVGLLQPDNKREIKPCDKNIFILWESKIPSVIVECGFLSNQDEEAKLKNSSYQKDVAFSLYCGFLQFWKNV